jgi:hypothetical protein
MKAKLNSQNYQRETQALISLEEVPILQDSKQDNNLLNMI